MTTCSTIARAHGEPLAGTAGRAAGFLVLEIDGSWSRDALTAVDRGLRDRAANAGVKVLAVRRPGHHAARQVPRQRVLLAHAGPTPWLERAELTDEELAALDPACCAAASPPGLGTEQREPRWLVCTHARRDRCCATLGRPIADTLSALHPATTLECSHLGGHRFAGMVLTLPDGLLYGGLDVAGAVEVVSGHLAGRMTLDALRGRSRLPKVAQLAEIVARRELGDDRLDSHVEVLEAPADTPMPGADPRPVVVSIGGRTVAVEVAAVPDPPARRLSCDAEQDEVPVHLVATAVRVAAG